MTIPNSLTLLRIFLLPVIVLVYYLPLDSSYTWAAGLFLMAALTDWLDGYLARRLHQATRFGAFLDPVADKLTVSLTLLLLVDEYDAIWMTLPAMVIVGREIVISALREWMAQMGQRSSVAVSYIGKFKTAVQMVSIVLLLSTPPDTHVAIVGITLLYIATVLTLWSMSLYLYVAWQQLRQLN
jgi:CDP-diacylglycerol---glycerol-3-phosphate 3-phosphatidyltransferase